MKDEFYIVLPSNSSMQYFPNNTTTHFVTQLPQQIRLQGSWCVAITEIQIPLTFQHISSENAEREIIVKRLAHTILESNKVRAEASTATKCYLRPGVYKNLESLVDEINNLEGVKQHLHFTIERGCYISVKRICKIPICSELDHYLSLSDKLKKILGFENKDDCDIRIDKEKKDSVNETVGNRPANLSNGIPSMFMFYSDICEPYVTGDVQSRLLRTVSLNVDDYTYNSIKMKSFSPPMYIPLLFNAFQTIEIDIRDQHGKSIPFDFGTLTVTLHFKRID